MCFKQPKPAPAPVPTTPAYVEPATSQQSGKNTGVSIKGYDGPGTTNVSSTSQGDSDDAAIRRRRRTASSGLGL